MCISGWEGATLRHGTGGVDIMPENLQKLIEEARKRPFPTEEREEQRRSFAFGNTNIENPLVTREMVAEEDEILKAETLTA